MTCRLCEAPEKHDTYLGCMLYWRKRARYLARWRVGAPLIRKRLIAIDESVKECKKELSAFSPQ